jgi:hypothetical protein
MESKFVGINSTFLLSIIIPTYNRHDELSKLLEQLSVELLPVREHVELLISNNNSRDETEKVAHEFIAKQSDVIAVRYFKQTSNIGPASNLHFLVKQSRSVFTWLSLWLQSLGAELTGFALSPPSQPSLFDEAKISEGMNSIIGDIRDLSGLQHAMQAARPEIVIHMAAQPLVRYSYQNPVEIYSGMIMSRGEK